jgi:hypothetical protein
MVIRVIVRYPCTRLFEKEWRHKASTEFLFYGNYDDLDDTLTLEITFDRYESEV